MYDLYTPGGGTPDETFYALVIKSVMERDWGIRDRQSAQAMISWLEEEGHNQALLKYYEEHNLGQYETDVDLNASWDSGQGACQPPRNMVVATADTLSMFTYSDR